MRTNMSGPEGGRAPGWRGAALAFAVYLGATLLYFAGALPGMARGFPGGPVAATDGWQHVWHLWWAERALAAGANPFAMPLLYHPDGVNLAVHPLNLATGLLFAPVTALAGPVAAFNVAMLAAFALTGLAGYLLALRAGARPPAALVAGLLLTFGPFHVTKAYDGQLELASLQWMALYAWLLLVAAEGRGWRAPALAGLLLGVVGYTSLYYLVYSAVYSALFVLLWLPWRERGRVGPYVARMALVPVVALIALAPLLANLRGALGEVTGGEPLGAGTTSQLLTSRSANLLDFWLPSYLHPLWGPAVGRLGAVLHPDISAWNHALGYTALGLAAVACAAAWPRAWRWLAIAVAGLVLALGPTLLVGTAHTGIPMPYGLLLLVPGMDMAQRPGHLVVLTALALTPLAGLGLSALVGRFGRRAAVIAVALAAFELAPPLWPTQPFVVDAAYAELAQGQGALLVLPPEIDSSEVLRDQIVHGRPIVGGYLARTPPNPFADYTPGVRQLWRMEPDPATLGDPAGGTPAQTLAAYGITDVVVRWGRVPPARRAGAEAALAQVLPGVAPSYADDSLAVYRVPPSEGAPLAFFGAGWYDEERDGERRWRWMPAAAELTLVNPTGAPRPVTLRLSAESYARPRVAELRLNGAPVGAWEVGGGTGSDYSMRLLLPPGSSRLAITAPADPDAGGRGPISLSVTELRIE